MNGLTVALNSALGFGKAQYARFVASKRSTKAAILYGVIHVAAMPKANKLAQRRTNGKGIARTAKLTGKTLLGPLYIAGVLGSEFFAQVRKEVKKQTSKKIADPDRVVQVKFRFPSKKARKPVKHVKHVEHSNRPAPLGKFGKKQIADLNKDLRTILTPNKSLQQMRNDGIRILRKHHAPKAYVNQFTKEFDMMIKSMKNEAKTARLVVKHPVHSKNKFESKKPTATPANKKPVATPATQAEAATKS